MIKGISLFANAGIAETYLKEVGVDIVLANELVERRARFYKHLYPECDVVTGDITDPVVFDRIISRAKELHVEFLIATPPCQGMSIAGLMNPYDDRNSLVKYAIDAIKLIQPKFVLLENVPRQMVTPICYKGEELLIPEYILQRLSDSYNISVNPQINTADYGIPQRRERAIFLMTRKDCMRSWTFPEKDISQITLEEAFEGIPDLWPIIRDPEYANVLPANTAEALSFHKWHIPPTHSWRHVLCMLYTPTGNTAFDNEYYYPRNKDGSRIKGYDTTYHRMFWDKPAPTVTRHNSVIGSQNNVHPGRPWKKDSDGNMMYTNPRVLSIYELMVVSSLPTDWNIPDWASHELIRQVIGEGIPPLLIKKIVERLGLRDGKK